MVVLQMKQFEYRMFQLDAATETLPARWLSMKSTSKTLSLTPVVGLPLLLVSGCGVGCMVGGEGVNQLVLVKR